MRRSAKYRGSYALSVKYKGTAQHYIIKNDNNGGIRFIVPSNFRKSLIKKIYCITESKILKLYLGSHFIIDWRGWSTEVKNMYVDKLMYQLPSTCVLHSLTAAYVHTAHVYILHENPSQ